MSTWPEATTLRIGVEIRRLRGKRSAQWLADRTAALGASISRASIAELENGKRQSVSVADLLVLAAALEVPPVALLLPELPDGSTDVLPGVTVPAVTALRWISGESPLFPPSPSGVRDLDGHREALQQQETFEKNAATIVRARRVFELQERVRVASSNLMALTRRIESMIGRGQPAPDDTVALRSIWQQRFDESTEELYFMLHPVPGLEDSDV